MFDIGRAERLSDPAWLAARVRDSGADRVLAEASALGVEGLVVQTLPRGVDAVIDRRRRELILQQALLDAELRRVAHALAAAGVSIVILKGPALARAHYPAPWTRVGCDIDVLIDRADRAKTSDVFRALGYGLAGVTGRWIMQQDVWAREASGARFVFDVHLEATNRVFFAARLRPRDLLARAAPAPYAGPSALELDAVDALIYSSVHRVVHHAADREWRWTIDIARQAAALDAHQTAELVARARALGLASIVAAALTEASRMWRADAGACAALVRAALAAAAAGEPAAVYLTPRSRARDFWLDWRALPRWRDRARLMTELVSPSSEFLRQQAGGSAFIPWLYVRRVVRGGRAWMTTRRG